MMKKKPIDPALALIADKENWGNCPACGYFFKRSKLPHCPVCRHEWRKKVGYTQPPYEPPTIE